jgi:hypothetical protein
MAEYQCPTLEEVFLQLCRSYDSKNQTKITPQTENQIQTIDTNDVNLPTNNRLSLAVDLTRVKALLVKYWVLTKRRPMLLASYYFVTALTLLTWNLLFGRDVNRLPVALYNGDECPQNLSRMFVQAIDVNRISFRDYTDRYSAVESVRKGVNHMAVEFRYNFSEAFESRVTDVFGADDQDIEQSLIHLYVDNTSIIFFN